jgi:hypothetical protein
MKVIGITINKNEIISAVLENKNGSITDLTERRKILLENDDDSQNLCEFKEIIHSYFDTINPDKIAIVKRATNGKFISAPISYKIEGLIQIYKTKKVVLISPKTIKAFISKNKLPFVPKFNRQLEAYELAMFILNN